MEWALVVHDNIDFGQSIAGLVESALDRKVECETAANIEDATRLLRKRGYGECGIVVCSLTARSNADEPPEIYRQHLTGIDFVQQLHREGCSPPAILLSSFADTERLGEVAKVKGVPLLTVKEIGSRLIEEVRKAVHGRGAIPRRFVDLDIVLRLREQCSWRIDGDSVEDTGLLDVDRGQLADLIGFSQPARSGDITFFRSLGKRVYELLLFGDLELKLVTKAERVGGLEFARIRFNVDESTHRILFETLAKPIERDGEPEFWTLRTPIFRKFGNRGGRYPLFKDEWSNPAPVDCLLILGCTSMFAVVEPFRAYIDALPGAQQEVDTLRKRLEAAQSRGVGAVTLLRHGDYPKGEFAAAIKSTLTGGAYRLVHYAGHSYIDRSSGKAYLALGKDDLLPIEEFAESAASVQFVFLSSCESASSEFIMKLVRTDVPAVAGFAWPVRDRIAKQFAEVFYDRLFGDDELDNHSLEYSFTRAKRSLHDSYPHESHWAAPLLFMQMFRGTYANPVSRRREAA